MTQRKKTPTKKVLFKETERNYIKHFSICGKEIGSHKVRTHWDERELAKINKDKLPENKM